MFSVEEVISQLILRHSCVIIPSFGGFVAQVIPASIDKENGLILPPSKHLLFNKNLINNDGLLTAAFASSNKISFNDSVNKIDSFTLQLKSELFNGKKVDLPQIGTFHLDAEKNICFEQNRYFNFLLSAYGLGNVQFIPSIDKKVEVIVEKNETAGSSPIIPIQTPIVNIDKNKSGRKFIKYIASAACFLPIAFYSFWIPVKTDVLKSGVISINDFNPFYKKQTGYYSPRKSDLFHFKLEDVNYKPLVVVETKKPIDLISNTSNNSTTTENYLVTNKRQSFEYIVGCFSSSDNAIKLVNSLKNQGFDAAIIKGGNLTRVSIGCASSEKILDSLIQLSNSKGYQGWILK